MTRLLLFLAAAALLAGCARGFIRKPDRAADTGAKLVSRVWYNPGPGAWQASPWFRVQEDMITPTRVIISNDDYACIMGTEVNEPQMRDYYVCPTAWRYPQRRGQ